MKPRFTQPLKNALYSVVMILALLAVYCIDFQDDNLIRHVEFVDAVFTLPGPDGNLIEHREGP